MTHQVVMGRMLLALMLVAVATAPAVARQHDHGAMAMPESGLRAELIRDLDQLEQKYVALAAAMTGHYGWRPGDGVRSVSEVFMHVAGANFMLPSMAGIDAPAAAAGATETEVDPARVQELLAHSFRHARHSIAHVPDAQLDDEIRMFGRPATKRALLVLLVAHMHEHLGQAIAYARVNGVTPPWSE
jgi:uncharacterized damage-inducible protein DinB